MPSLPCERASCPGRRQAACCPGLYSNAVDEVFTFQPPAPSAARLGCLARTADNRRTSCAAPTSLREGCSPQHNIFRVRYITGVRDQATLDLFLNRRSMMPEVTVNSTPNLPLVALRTAFVKLMRIIPDSRPGYSDAIVTVKRYLLDGAASALCALLFGAHLLCSPRHSHPLPGGRPSTRRQHRQTRLRIIPPLPLPDAHGES
jgi:hypothetical protein